MEEKPEKSQKSSRIEEPNSAADVIRDKLDKIYQDEPDAKDEIAEVENLPDKRLSKHQRYMDELSTSKKSLAEIQTAWHQYYVGLSDKEKHEVWKEFYANHENAKSKSETKPKQKEDSPPKAQPTKPSSRTQKKRHTHSAVTENPKEDLLTRIAKRSTTSKKKAHAHSLLFGLGLGSLVVFILMFSFFNERIVTPFIRPSQNVSATPIIVDPNNLGPVGPEPKIIIPKINVEAPVVYDEPSTDEKAIQNALERGVVHYAITPNPGELGNAVIVGHSSSNILNNGRFKFAFLLLKSLENGDTFIVQKDGKRYVYKVYNKYVTSPKDVSVLNPPDPSHKAIMTLITCDPPGLSTNRLIIQADQIYPNPSTNKESSATPSSASEPKELPSNAPSLWSRLVGALF